MYLYLLFYILNISENVDSLVYIVIIAKKTSNKANLNNLISINWWEDSMSPNSNMKVHRKTKKILKVRRIILHRIDFSTIFLNFFSFEPSVVNRRNWKLNSSTTAHIFNKALKAFKHKTPNQFKSSVVQLR